MPPSTIADMMFRMVRQESLFLPRTLLLRHASRCLLTLLQFEKIEQKEYSGGTCVLKTIVEERIVEGKNLLVMTSSEACAKYTQQDGWDKQADKYDPYV